METRARRKSSIDENTAGLKRRKNSLTDKVEEQKARDVIIQFRDSEDQNVGFEISVPTDTSKADLNKLLMEVRDPADDEDHQRYQFYLDDKEVKASIQEVLTRIQTSKLIDAQAKKQ